MHLLQNRFDKTITALNATFARIDSKDIVVQQMLIEWQTNTLKELLTDMTNVFKKVTMVNDLLSIHDQDLGFKLADYVKALPLDQSPANLLLLTQHDALVLQINGMAVAAYSPVSDQQNANADEVQAMHGMFAKVVTRLVGHNNVVPDMEKVETIWKPRMDACRARNPYDRPSTYYARPKMGMRKKVQVQPVSAISEQRVLQAICAAPSQPNIEMPQDLRVVRPVIPLVTPQNYPTGRAIIFPNRPSSPLTIVPPDHLGPLLIDESPLKCLDRYVTNTEGGSLVGPERYIDTHRTTTYSTQVRRK
jgi:hypothetical protein